MHCEFMDDFPDSRARATHGLRALFRAAQRGIAGQLAAAALIALPVRAMADDPVPPVPPPAHAPPAPPDNPPVPPPQVIEAGSLPARDDVPEANDGARYQVPEANSAARTEVPEAAPPPPDDAPPPPEVYSRADSPGPQLSAAPPKAPPVDGQWVYTSQYGWVWMPYAQAYTYVPDDGYPTMYVYGATFGWRWVAAPWIYDYGPAPYWGPRGRVSFVWYSRPWFTRRVYVGPTYYYGPRHYYYRGGPRYYSAPRVYSAPRSYSAPRYRGYDRPRGYDRGDRREVHVHGSGGHSHGGHRH
jgi:hypothetical protein